MKPVFNPTFKDSCDFALGVINILHTANNPMWTYYIASVFTSIIGEESMDG